MRLKVFLKGAFLYNTIYWRRASDDLDIQRMSREERANLRPKRNLEIIRPRWQPRAFGGPTISLPPVESKAAQGLVQSDSGESTSNQVPLADGSDPDDEPVEIRRRKKRRGSRHSRVMPKKYYSAGSDGGGGILGWLFRK